ncbi:MAG: hypothetical protein M0Q43_09765 [Methanothrix sp.]|jgi:hypothetical protein|nr:hypothetical protein [Methanothrix sp.]
MDLDDVEDMMVTGHPEQTDEKIVGFLDPRQWTTAATAAGSTQVLWTAWAKSNWKLINERAEMNLIFSRAVDGELAAAGAIEELSTFDDPIARLDFIPTLEQMQ